MHLTPQQLNELYPYLFGFWTAIGLVALAFFNFNKNAPLKRRVLIVGSIATNGLMLVFFWVTGARPCFSSLRPASWATDSGRAFT